MNQPTKRYELRGLEWRECADCDCGEYVYSSDAGAGAGCDAYHVEDRVTTVVLPHWIATCIESLARRLEVAEKLLLL
jgi:hypothetical protein